MAEINAAETMSTYLGEDSDELDGFEFMAEAGQVGHSPELAAKEDPNS